VFIQNEMRHLTELKQVKTHTKKMCNRKEHLHRTFLITDAEPVRVQLIKSFCLPLLAYCIGALKLKRSVIQELSVCWNNVFRRIFSFKKWESVRVLQVNFGTLDFMHLYDLYR